MKASPGNDSRQFPHYIRCPRNAIAADRPLAGFANIAQVRRPTSDDLWRFCETDPDSGMRKKLSNLRRDLHAMAGDAAAGNVMVGIGRTTSRVRIGTDGEPRGLRTGADSTPHGWARSSSWRHLGCAQIRLLSPWLCYASQSRRLGSSPSFATALGTRLPIESCSH